MHIPLAKIHALLKNVDCVPTSMVSHDGIGDHTLQGEVHVMKIYKLQHIHPAIPTVNA